MLTAWDVLTVKARQWRDRIVTTTDRLLLALIRTFRDDAHRDHLHTPHHDDDGNL